MEQKKRGRPPKPANRAKKQMVPIIIEIPDREKLNKIRFQIMGVLGRFITQSETIRYLLQNADYKNICRTIIDEHSED